MSAGFFVLHPHSTVYFTYCKRTGRRRGFLFAPLRYCTFSLLRKTQRRGFSVSRPYSTVHFYLLRGGRYTVNYCGGGELGGARFLLCTPPVLYILPTAKNWVAKTNNPSSSLFSIEIDERQRQDTTVPIFRNSPSPPYFLLFLCLFNLSLILPFPNPEALEMI